MSFKNYYTDLKKERIYTIVNIKDSIIALEWDITKIYQNFKRIVWKIYYLYKVMLFENFEKMLKSDIDKIFLNSHIHSEKKIQFNSE